MSLRRAFLGLATSALLIGTAGAADLPLETEIRVYTNADLRALPSDSATGAPAEPNGSDDGWAFVQAHLAREYARLDADRGYELDRAALSEVREPRERAIWALPYAPRHFGVNPNHRGSHGRHLGRGIRAQLTRSSPRPIHAGPTRTQVFRARAIRNSGADVFRGR